MKKLFCLLAALTTSVLAGPIQDAINAAPEGAVVEIPAGQYAESIILKPGMFLVGAGAEQTVIDAEGAETGVRLAKDSAIVGFTVRNAKVAIRNHEGAFAGVFECDVNDFAQQGVRVEGGSAALAHNRIKGTDQTVGIACLGSNPYIGYSLIEGHRVGLQAVSEFIPTVDHCVFEANKTAIELLGGAKIVSKNNIFSHNENTIAGQELGEQDEVRAATANDLILHRGNEIESYRDLMREVFSQSVALHPRVVYDLTETPGRFHLTISYPWATFTVLASTRDTVIEAYDAYDASNNHDLNATPKVAMGHPGIAVENPTITEKNLDRYVLEKMFIHPPSLSFTADGKLVFDRITNIPRIEVQAPAGYRIAEVNHDADIVEENGRSTIRFSEMGMTHIRMVMEKAP